MVGCIHKQHGCTWTGEVRNLSQHICDKCEHRRVVCPKACGEHVEWIRMSSHTAQECRHREYQCFECLVIGPYNYITGDHMTDCLMSLESCPSLGCDAHLCSALLLFHMHTECEFTPIECKFTPAGCTVRLPRSELQLHERDDRAHVKILLKKLEEYKTELEECKRYLTEWNTRRDELKDPPGKQRDDSNCQHTPPNPPTDLHHTTFRIHNFCYFTSTTHQFEVAVSPDSYKLLLELVLDAAGQRIRAFISVLRGSRDDHLLWPFTGDVKIELLSQVDDCDHYERTLTFPACCGMKVTPLQSQSDYRYCFHDYILYSELRKLGRFYVREDTIDFRVTAKYSKHCWNTEPRIQYLP